MERNVSAIRIGLFPGAGSDKLSRQHGHRDIIKMKFKIIIASAFILALFSLSAQAKIYRWTDTNGVVHFSQLPPPGVKAKAIGEKPISTFSGANQTPSRHAGQESAPPQTDSKTAPTSAKASPADCESARKNLTALQSGKRLKLVLADGKTEWLNQQEREKRLKQTRDFLQQHCR